MEPLTADEAQFAADHHSLVFHYLGIAFKEYQDIKPIVDLKPYRTFQEVDQPESAFLCRVNDKCEIGLFEADGGMWRLQARENVKAFLAEQLSDEVQNDKVYITL